MQIRGLEIVAVLGQLLNRVAAIQQHALVAVDVRDGAPAVRGVHERRVVRHQAEVIRPGLDLTQIHGADRAVLNRQLVLLARSVVDDAQRVAHRSAFKGACCRRYSDRLDRFGNRLRGDSVVPSAHWARSSSLHRSLQNGRHSGSTGCFRQNTQTGGSAIPLSYCDPLDGQERQEGPGELQNGNGAKSRETGRNGAQASV